MDMSSAASDAVREVRFRSVYDSTYADLLRFVRRRVHPSHAEDVVAEVYLVAWRRFEALPAADDQARAWLFGVARGLLLNASRGQDRHQALTVRIAELGVPTVGAAGDHSDLVSLRLDVAAAWPQLSPTEQEALALVFWDGLTAPEAAGILQITAVAFRLRLSRARRALRRHLGELHQNRGRSDHRRITSLPEGTAP